MRFSALEFNHLTKMRRATERVRQEERQMLATVKDAWGKCSALISGEREIQDPMVKRSANQSGAARFLWTSGDMVMDVSGIAGADKTTLLREVVPALRAEGISVLLLAPTAASEKHLSSEFPPLWRSSSRRRGHSGLARECGGCRQSCRVIRHL
jgi:primosomal protein N'